MKGEESKGGAVPTILKFNQHSQGRPGHRQTRLVKLQATTDNKTFDNLEISGNAAIEETKWVEDDDVMPVPFESYENKNGVFTKFNRSPFNAAPVIDNNTSNFRQAQSQLDPAALQRQCQKIVEQQKQKSQVANLGLKPKKNKKIIDRDHSIEGLRNIHAEFLQSPLEIKSQVSIGDEPLKQISEAELRKRRGQRFNSRNKLRQNESQTISESIRK